MGKYIILIIGTIFLGFAVDLFLFIPLPTLADENGWLGFYGELVGAGIAGIITLWGIEYTIKSTVMNVKPFIRPVRKDFFLYEKEGYGLTITEKPLFRLIDEFVSTEKVNVFEINEYILSSIIDALAKKTIRTQWKKNLLSIDQYEMCYMIKEICGYRTYQEAYEILRRELDKEYCDGIGRVVAENIIEHFNKLIVINIMSHNLNERDVFFSIYNTGAGNATDIRIGWDFTNDYCKQLCNNLGFTEEYKDMLDHFSLEDIEVTEVDVMLNINGENMIKVPVPREVLRLIKLLHIKSVENAKEGKSEKNNVLVGEHKLAELHIICNDIYGEEHNFDYIVMFQIQPAIWNKYGYNEIRFYLKFIHIK